MTTFDICLASVLKEEGGYVNNPLDKGGATNLGATQAAWSAWIGHPATIADMMALTPSAVTPFYRVNYWQPIYGDALPPALALCVFHASVNSGPGTAARSLQAIVGASVDGHIGPATLKEVQAYASLHGISALVQTYQDVRTAYYRTLSNFSTFGAGWLARNDRIETQALAMIPTGSGK